MEIKVKESGRFKTPQLDQGALTKIGNEMVDAQKARWARFEKKKRAA